MKYFILFSLCAAATQAYSVSDRKVPKPTAVQAGGRIFYGEDAVNGQFPHMVFTSVYCGGALISDKWVLSAAHCYSSLPVSAFLGDVNKYLSPVLINVIKISFHPGWDGDDLNYDIALLELEKSLTFTANIKPIRIPSPNEVFEGELAIISGFGYTHDSDGQTPEVLQYVRQIIIGDEECWGTLMICGVGYPTPLHDSCGGDSGSPLIVRRPEGDLLVGILSGGAEHCDGEVPAAHVKPHAVLDWIRNITELDL